MKNRRISVQISKTINTGNYESLKIQAGIETDIVDGADLDGEYELLWDAVEDELTEKIESLWAKKEPVPNNASSRIVNRKPKVRR